MSLETFLGLTLSQWQEAYEAFILKEKGERDFLIGIVREVDLSIWRLGRRMVYRWLFPGKKRTAIETDMWEMPGDKELKQKGKKEQRPSSRKRFEALAKKWGS